MRPWIASVQRASSENARAALLTLAGRARHNDLRHPSTRPLTLKRNALQRFVPLQAGDNSCRRLARAARAASRGRLAIAGWSPQRPSRKLTGIELTDEGRRGLHAASSIRLPKRRLRRASD